jgi:hypothetical protein
MMCSVLPLPIKSPIVQKTETMATIIGETKRLVLNASAR